LKSLKTILTVTLALLVLVSSTHFVVGFHVCMGELQEIALFSKAEGCAMEKSLPPCHQHSKAPCCEDEVVLHNADAFKADAPSVFFETFVSTESLATLVLLADIIPDRDLQEVHFPDYDPPLPATDRVITHRVLLI